jgi:23S rRNA (adenine2503-C2)-methyltransferase
VPPGCNAKHFAGERGGVHGWLSAWEAQRTRSLHPSFGPTYNTDMNPLLPVVPGAGRLPALLDQPADTLRAWLAERGQPAMRAKQIRHWLIANRAESFEQMSDLPRELRGELAQSFAALGTRVEHERVASDGTHKLLLRLHDDQLIECVLIQDRARRTACISTQVGCGMGCVFCASGLNGMARNLTAGEILEQLIRLRNLTLPGERLTHIVVMGMGEPLANLDNLLEALQTAGDKDGLNIGARHVTISTVGLPVKIRRVADLGKQYHLAVSLHAPNDGLRSRIVPTNEQTGIEPILAAADYFFDKTGRQVTYEYVLLGGLNDSPREARELATLLRGRRAHVNLIPFNEVEGLPYRRPTPEAVAAFVETLQRSGLSVKVRKRKGSEIDAACGQLRRQVTGMTNDPPAVMTNDQGMTKPK